MSAGASIPPLPRLLGFAGLLPQFAALLAVWVGPEEWHYAALAIGFGYGALILSFLGGLWWGIAAAAQAEEGRRAPGWIWVAAVMPSLVALTAYLPWVFGHEWPGPGLLLIGGALLASVLIDWRLAAMRMAPPWWLRLRLPLSLGLGGLTLALGVLS